MQDNNSRLERQGEDKRTKAEPKQVLACTGSNLCFGVCVRISLGRYPWDGILA